MIEAFPFQSRPYHHSKAVTGCLGFFLQNMKNISAGCNTGPLGSIFREHTLQIFTDIGATSGGYIVNLTLGKSAQLGLIPGFGHLHPE